MTTDDKYNNELMLTSTEWALYELLQNDVYLPEIDAAYQAGTALGEVAGAWCRTEAGKHGLTFETACKSMQFALSSPLNWVK